MLASLYRSQRRMDYSPGFYRQLRGGSSESARRIVPWLLELLRPSSVVDVGCGTGAWLQVFDELGVRDLLGVDGHFHSDLLDVSPDRYVLHDLREPIRMHRRFDLVVSVEVAEHLPADSAQGFVESLASLGEVILFSAAVPGQGGTHHVNEQWSDYWVKRFGEIGYRAFDCFRARFWADDHIEWWYRQNLFLYVAKSRLKTDPPFCQLLENIDVPLPARLVHPVMHLARTEVMKKVLTVVQNLAAHVPTSAKLVLIDEDKFRTELSAWKGILSFPEKNGKYNGRPTDSMEAIRELERLRETGAEYAAVTDAAFWWLHHYKSFGAHLSETYHLCFHSDSLMIFDLRQR